MTTNIIITAKNREGVSINIDSLPVSLKVNSFTWHCLGGPLMAEIQGVSDDRESVWEFIEWLRYEIILLSPTTGLPVWWGIVSGVSIRDNSGFEYGVEIDSMYNRVRADFTYQADGETSGVADITTWAQDDDSVDEFGARELIVKSNNVSTAFAENDRDTALEVYKYPQPTITPGDGSETTYMAVLRLSGWWTTLDWMYYLNSGNTYETVEDQILYIIAQCGQFFGDVETDLSATILTSPYRDGSQTGRGEVEKLLQAGSDNLKWILATVNSDLTVSLFEEPDRVVTVYMAPNGELTNGNGVEILPETCPVGCWLAATTGVPQTADLSRLTAPFPAFVVEATWDSEGGYTPVTRGKPSPFELLGGLSR